MEILKTIWNAILGFLPRFLSAGLILLVGFFAIKVIRSILRKWMNKKINISFHVFIDSCVKIVLWIFVFLCVAGALGLDTSSFITALGSAGLAIGLALQSSLSNLASGMMILIAKNYAVGDFIEVEGVSGTVKKIDLMFTTMNTPDNKEISIPNSKLTADIVINYTKNDIRRVDLTYSISYDSSIEQAKTILADLCVKNPLVFQEPAPTIAVSGHGDSAVMIGVKVWCKKEDYWTVTFAMNEQVKLAFDEAGISIPFPQLDIHTK